VEIQGSVAIVTGAGRNIGEAIAHGFADNGVKVACVDLDDARARRTADGINALHPDCAMPVVCDVSDSAQVQRLVQEVANRLGRIDILVNNVAITDRGTIFDLSEQEWDTVMRVTVKSTFLCTKYVAQHMVERGGGGLIVNLASTSGHLGRRDATAYPAAKAAILNLSKALAIQLAPYGIRVNVVTPNKVGSPVGQNVVRETGEVKNLVGRNGVPKDVAAAVLFLASKDAAFIDGAEILVDGGAMAALQP
jgi:NAD(P)-dependent dehydrogenase (short-subunit alcohol dehydrogenase family)